MVNLNVWCVLNHTYGGLCNVTALVYLGENLEEKTRVDDVLLYLTPKVDSVWLHVEHLKAFI